jgi:hypothetical protein
MGQPPLEAGSVPRWKESAFDARRRLDIAAVMSTGLEGMEAGLRLVAHQ